MLRKWCSYKCFLKSAKRRFGFRYKNKKDFFKLPLSFPCKHASQTTNDMREPHDKLPIKISKPQENLDFSIYNWLWPFQNCRYVIEFYLNPLRSMYKTKKKYFGYIKYTFPKLLNRLCIRNLLKTWQTAFVCLERSME